MNENKITKNIKHGSIIPLAGGFSIGATNVIGRPPEVIFSYTSFAANDILMIRYFKKKGYDIPYYVLDDKKTNIKKVKDKPKDSKITLKSIIHQKIAEVKLSFR